MNRALLVASQFVLAGTVCVAITIAAQTVDHPLHVGGDVLPPKAIHTASPHAPRDGRSEMESGRALVAIVIDTTGHVTKAEIAKSSGDTQFDADAVKAAYEYTFTPATRAGEPVAVAIWMAMTYHIHVPEK